MNVRVPQYVSARLRRRARPLPPPVVEQPAAPASAVPMSSPRYQPVLAPYKREPRHRVPIDPPTGPLAGRAVDAMGGTEFADRDHGPFRTMLRAEDEILVRLAEAGGDFTAHRKIHLDGPR